MPFNRSDCIPALFIGSIIASHLQAIAKVRGQVIKFGQDSTLRGLFVNLYRYVEETMIILNMSFRDEGPYGGRSRVFDIIARLMWYDLWLDDPLYRNHIDGFFAYLRHMGGVHTVLITLNPPVFHFQSVLSMNLKRRLTLSGCDIQGGRYCQRDKPTESTALWARLRARAFAGELTETSLTASVHHLFDEVSSVEVDDWIRETSAHTDNAVDLAAIFRAAVLLYGILALPRRAVALWARSLAGNEGITRLDAYGSVRLAQQKALLKMMRELAPRLTCRCCITWPLTVLGVAVSDGWLDDARDFVVESFLFVSAERGEGGGGFKTLRKLREFWSSGKTGWDDCFQEPFIAFW
ncbi:hypothetical protein NLG97_g8572 [Lecanicillium saksenae]|uniref:Uncharacterized protein n=1 Tax=Lecanicillium saksenae TaxID=468837 RepID=A0ACC1QIN0_9HYPO|nr:hypothetical protein NLG97_g8572 [Lecanicillium saksenae]